MADLMAHQTKAALKKFYKVGNISSMYLCLVIDWSPNSASVLRQADLDELMRDHKFLELLTIEHLNGD